MIFWDWKGRLYNEKFDCAVMSMKLEFFLVFVYADYRVSFLHQASFASAGK